MKLRNFLLTFQAIITMVESKDEFSDSNEIALESENAKIIGLPQVSCDSKWLSIRLETSIIFQGRVYVNGRAFDRRCSEQFTQNQSNTVVVKLSILDCANFERANKTSRRLNNESALLVWANIRVDFHPIFITKTSQVFRAECNEVYGLDYSQQSIGPVNTICAHQLYQSNSFHNDKEDDSPKEFTVGETISHSWTCSDKYSLRKYAMMLRNCDVISRSKHAVQLIDQTGCTVDETLLTNVSARVPPQRIPFSLLSLMNSSKVKNANSTDDGVNDGKDENYRLVTTAKSRIFKFLEESELRFRCSIMLIPRPVDFATIEVPKCSISREELQENSDRSSDVFQFVNPNREFRDVIETVTITNWFRVSERLPIRNYDRKFPLPTVSLDTKFADSPVDGFQQISDSGVNDVRPSLTHIPSKIVFGNEPTPSDDSESHSNNKLAQVMNISQNRENILAFTTKTMVSSSLGTPTIKIPSMSSASYFCMWRSFNWVLLLWSTASALIWLVILGRKIFHSLTKHSNDDSDSFLGTKHTYKFPPKESRRQTPYGKKYRHPPSNLVSVTRNSSTCYEDRLRDAGFYSEYRPNFK